VKKEEMTEGRKASRANKTKPGPPLSSKSGSATEQGHLGTFSRLTDGLHLPVSIKFLLKGICKEGLQRQ